MGTSGGLGCDGAVGSLCVARRREYRVSGRVQEGKRLLYAIAFNFIDSRYLDAFAIVGGNRQQSTMFIAAKKIKKEKDMQPIEFEKSVAQRTLIRSSNVT